MSKVSEYLNEHISGEVIVNRAVREHFSTDAGMLSIMPEMVVYPRLTNDIRKVARFAWQLAEKGHVLPLTARGGGSDQTGGAIGKGIIIATTTHLNEIFELDVKQKLIRVQPGVTFKALNDALMLQGLRIPSYPASSAYSTIGGAVANNASGELSGKYGSTDAWTGQLEVVLANGDVLQTGRISRRELNHKKGLQTFEGEIYRRIDGLIMDNLGVIDGIATDVRDNVGYSGIAKVKQRDGSLDLTPLFLGSQGTLGIVSELIMKAEYFSPVRDAGILAFDTAARARDVIDVIARHEPAFIDFIDGEIFHEAVRAGKTYPFYADAVATDGPVGAVILYGFDDFSDHARSRKMKRLAKDLRDITLTSRTASSPDEVSQLLSVRSAYAFTLSPRGAEDATPPVVEGAYVPAPRFEEFSVGVSELAKKHHISLPLTGHCLDNTWHARPVLQLKKVTHKQLVLKLLDDYAALVATCGGHLVGEAGEGRVKAPFALRQLDEAEAALYDEIKTVFDPYNILNPGVKQITPLKDLVTQLRPEYSQAARSEWLPGSAS